MDRSNTQNRKQRNDAVPGGIGQIKQQRAPLRQRKLNYLRPYALKIDTLFYFIGDPADCKALVPIADALLVGMR